MLLTFAAHRRETRPSTEVPGPRKRSARWLWGAVILLAGCGGGSEPTVSDANKYLMEARRAVGDGDTAKALTALTASIEAQPNAWAYMERAKINAQQGNDQAVLTDCTEILKLDPKNRDVPWLKGELKKPKEKRFQGQFAIPPSYRK
jgi:hypothetical protein